jgi:hypothetical protein
MKRPVVALAYAQTCGGAYSFSNSMARKTALLYAHISRAMKE